MSETETVLPRRDSHWGHQTYSYVRQPNDGGLADFAMLLAESGIADLEGKTIRGSLSLTTWSQKNTRCSEAFVECHAMLILIVSLLLSTSTPVSLEEVGWGKAYPNCEKAAADDFRPDYLCRSETDFERAEIDTQRQWLVTLARVKIVRGMKAEQRLHHEQRRWVYRRNQVCAAFAADTPSTQVARNELDCMTAITARRTEELKAIFSGRVSPHRVDELYGPYNSMSAPR